MRGKRENRRGSGRAKLILALFMILLVEAAAIFMISADKRRAAQPSSTLQSSQSEPVSAPVREPETEPQKPESLPQQEQPTAELPEQSAPEPEERGTAEELLARMTLREKICQLFFVAPSDITGVQTVIAAGESTRSALQKYPVGGLFYDKTNLVSKEQVREMLETVQTYSVIPLLLACDEEGGTVNRLMDTVGTTRIGPMLDYKDRGPDTANKNAETIALDMRSCGFNMDFAPVADVWSNPENKVIGSRAYSDDFVEAADLISAAVAGFHQGGVACTLKHFPGHGDTSSDSHYGAVIIKKKLARIREEELLPFQAGIAAGADAVMVGHLIVEDAGDEPAPFSSRLITEILRGELGFRGIVITDSLRMQAITDHFTDAEVAVKAISAGVDMLLCPRSIDASISALEDAVASGAITEARIDESVLRILRTKENAGLLA